MKITKYGHAAFLIEEGKARILLDPGAFSSGFESLTQLNAIIYTHEHGDHFDRDKLDNLAQANPKAVILADDYTANIIKDMGYHVQAVRATDKVAINGVEIEVFGGDHAVIHPDVPVIPNVGYLIGKTFFYPGDALFLPDRPIPLMALPVAAPWTKIWEVVEYARAVNPKLMIPAHEAVVSMPEMYYSMITRLTEPKGIEFRPLGRGETIEV